MAVPTTWTLLKSEIATLAIRDDLEDLIPNFIGYAENWMQRELFSPEREETTTLSITDNYAALPSDYNGLKNVYVDGNRDTVLTQVTPETLRETYPGTNTGTPLNFAIEGERMYFGPWPSAGTVIILKYVEGIPKLGASQETNWVLTDHPDLYVAATLAEAFDYTRDPDEANLWRTKASYITESINRAGRRRKTNSGPLAARSPVNQVSRFAVC